MPNIAGMTPPPVSLRNGLTERERAKLQILFQRFLTLGGTRVATAVTLAAANVVVTFPRNEPDTNYGAIAIPNWGTTIYINTKTTTGMTINFGTVAPASATVDWITFRAET